MEPEVEVSGMTAQRPHCPSCGRFVGPYATCPYCGTHLEGRLPLRAVKIGAVVLAVVGLVALWWWGRSMEVPLLTVEAAQGTMNMAYVRVQGRVVRSLTYEPEDGYLAFWLDDGTGEVRISAYRDVTEALLASERVPALGDVVEVAGTLRIREDYVSLTLNVPEHLELARPEPVDVKAGTLTALDEGLRVRVAGEVRRCTSPYEGLTLVQVRDDSGEVVVSLDETLVALTGALPEIVEGQGLEVVGTVTLYKDEPQLTPASVADLVLTAAPPEPTVIQVPKLSALSGIAEGSWISVWGHVVALEGFKGGMKATLDDGTAQITLLLWDSVYAALPDPAALETGAELTVAGELALYQDEWEIVPEQPTDLVIEQAAPAVPWVTIGELQPADVGRVVRLRGVLGVPEPFSAGVKAPLDDGTGTLTLLLWDNIAETVTPEPQAGLLVDVVGEIAEYQGALEIIPRSSADWRAEP